MAHCDHVHAYAPSGAEVTASLAAAARRFTDSGESWTAPRQRTYELLLQAGRPVKAYDLIAAYAGAGRPPPKPPTVYRALDFLVVQGLAHRIESLNAFLACHADHHGAAAEFLICDCCGRVEELDLAIGSAAVEAARARGFQPGRIVLEVHGACAACAGASPTHAAA